MYVANTEECDTWNQNILRHRQLQTGNLASYCIFSNIHDIWLHGNNIWAGLPDTMSFEGKCILAFSQALGATGYCQTHGGQCPWPQPSVVVAGPPCTPFASNGNQKGLDDKVIGSWIAFALKHRHLKTPVLCIENVVKKWYSGLLLSYSSTCTQ